MTKNREPDPAYLKRYPGEKARGKRSSYYRNGHAQLKPLAEDGEVKARASVSSPTFSPPVHARRLTKVCNSHGDARDYFNRHYKKTLESKGVLKPHEEEADSAHRLARKYGRHKKTHELGKDQY